MERSSGITELAMTVTLTLVVGACGGPATSSSPDATASPAPSASSVAVLPTSEPTGSPLPSPSTAATPSPPTEPSPIPSDTFHPPELAYVQRFVMRVAVSDLNVRSKPSKSGTSKGKARKGELFMVYDWPITANGYTWYLGYEQLENNDVVPELPGPYNEGYDEILGGWMATGTEDTPFLVPIAPRCPAVRDLTNVGAMLSSERITCFGSDILTLEGTVGCEGCGGVDSGSFEPRWLASTLDDHFLTIGADETWRTLALRVGPEGPVLPAGTAKVRVRGHFSDPRSPTCRITELGADGELSVPIANQAAEQWCRSKFVVESYAVIG